MIFFSHSVPPVGRKGRRGVLCQRAVRKEKWYFARVNRFAFGVLLLVATGNVVRQVLVRFFFIFFGGEGDLWLLLDEVDTFFLLSWQWIHE